MYDQGATWRVCFFLLIFTLLLLYFFVCVCGDALIERFEMATDESMSRRKQRSRPVEESKLVLESSFPSRVGRKRKMPTWLQDDIIAAEQVRALHPKKRKRRKKGEYVTTCSCLCVCYYSRET